MLHRIKGPQEVLVQPCACARAALWSVYVAQGLVQTDLENPQRSCLQHLRAVCSNALLSLVGGRKNFSLYLVGYKYFKFYTLFLVSELTAIFHWLTTKAMNMEADSVPGHFFWLDKFLIGCLWLCLCIRNSMLCALIFEKAYLEMAIKMYFCYSTSIETKVQKEVDNSWGHLFLEYSLRPYSIRTMKILLFFYVSWEMDWRN